MLKSELSDLNVFLLIADERSFSRAAIKLGQSQSALSYSMSRLETRIGLKLLHRTTRSVAPTKEGERLIATLRPALTSINDELAALSQLRSMPSGLIRITTPKYPFEKYLYPAVLAIREQHYDVSFEIDITTSVKNIIDNQFDAGIALREQIEKDMIAVPLGPEIRMVIIGKTSYFQKHGVPKEPADLRHHSCAAYRRDSTGRVYSWEFEKFNEKRKHKFDSTIIVNDVDILIKIISTGDYLCCVPEHYVSDKLLSGEYMSVLNDWLSPFSGYCLYYPDRNELTLAFRIFIDMLKNLSAQ
ncbi:LysR family transcriptional regulator [Pantoea sp. Cy-640]|uniref:LysR family transcriptional regulator n=1 Tax=Pantoea sp. Cy-640 TaxID=2608353 RepID=UPI00141A01C4|nr:LysR family transcriptional regulator [Pantoea sp. Cy-640]NIG16167.1 LysR family transcriptional regulator [Pantoea sp. Cy-640]